MRFLPSIVLALCTLLFGRSTEAQTAIRAAYPIAGAQQVSVRTSIAIVYPRPIDKQALDVGSIVVSGSGGHVYAGSVRLSADAKTLIFTPAQPLHMNEHVTLAVGPLAYATSGHSDAYTTNFVTEEASAPTELNYTGDDPITQMAVRARASGFRYDRSADLTPTPQGFPLLTVDNDDDPSDGKLYMANFKFVQTQGETYRMVLDKQGSILYAQTSDSHVILDFKPHSNGRYTYFDSPTSTFVVLDSNMNVTDTLRAANGYDMDGHDFRYNADGSYYVIALHYFKKDMRPVFPGADSNATVIDNVVQEFDKENNLIWEWRGLDHYQLTDIENESLSGPIVDYCHMNAIEIDTDGNLLLSCRHMDEITKVNRQSGEIMWRWGGKHNEFTFRFDTTGFSHQHAIRYVPTGTYTLFDNGNYHQHSATFSRAVEYKLDQVNKVASQVWEFRHQPLTYGYAMGYVQRLPNGNTLIGWGACANVAVTEVGPFNRTVFEMSMDSGNYSYRAYKYPAEYLQSTVHKSVDATASGTMTCYPNPVRESAEVRFSVAHTSPIDVTLFDLLGRPVASIAHEDLSEGSYSATIDARHIPAGSYYLRLSSGGEMQYSSVMIVK